MLRRATLRASSTIGIPSLLALLLGVPAMIAFIVQIWSALSQGQRSITVACIVLIIIAIGLFVYGQVRRELMVIPRIIYRMSERANELTGKIILNPDSEELRQFLSLIDMPGNDLAKILDYDTFKRIAPKLIPEVTAKANKARVNPQQSLRILQFIYEGYVRDALDNDNEYQNLKTLLRTKSPIIPTTELSQNILSYNKLAVTRCSCALMLQPSDERVLEVIPISYQLDAKIEMGKIDENLMVMLAKVNQSIDHYYNGDIQKDEGKKGK